MPSTGFVMQCPAIESGQLAYIHHDALGVLDSPCHGLGGNTARHQEVQSPGLDALEQHIEEERLLAIALNLQPSSIHSPVQGQPSIDEQDIVPRVAAERHV